jgi:N-acetylmuramoyl-L-alanine amidase
MLLASSIALGAKYGTPVAEVIPPPLEPVVYRIDEAAPSTVLPGPEEQLSEVVPGLAVQPEAPVLTLDPEPSAPSAINYPEPDTTCDVVPGTFDRARFREPLPAVARWNPPGQKRVGIQAGHWLTEQVPAELLGLGGGSYGGGKAEWEVNLDIARRVGAILEGEDIQVDILPTTVPVRYHAHAFVSIHADGDVAGRYSGFKVARPGFSSVPDVDDRLIGAINAAYQPATGLARDDAHISLRMLYYYAFNSRRFCHAVAPGVPQAIVETGFLTNAGDRDILLGNPDAAARGIANGIVAFLREE